MIMYMLVVLLPIILAHLNGIGKTTIAKVTPVAPIDGGLVDANLWSPTGAKLAFFSGGELTVCDTLGTTRGIAKVDLLPRSIAWASEKEILIYLRDYGHGDTVTHRLSVINLVTGTTQVLEQYQYSKRDKSTESARTFRGPSKSVEGIAYYYRVKEGREEPVVWPPAEKITLGQIHELRTGQDALYLVSLNATDSTRISNKPYRPYLSLPLNLSKDSSHIMFGGNIVRLSDDQLIMLDTLSQLKPYPPGTYGCGFGSESFNPVAPEVIFRMTCDDGHAYAVNRIGLFNYVTYELTFLDSTQTTTLPFEPAFSLDGRRISFIAHGVLYIAERGEK